MTKSFGNPSLQASRLRLAGVDSTMGAAERDAAAGELLLDLERRQDDVLLQLDELDKKLTFLLTGLGVTFVSETDASNHSIRLADLSDDSSDSESEMVQAHGDSDEYIQPTLRRKAA